MITRYIIYNGNSNTYYDPVHRPDDVGAASRPDHHISLSLSLSLSPYL